MCLGDSRWHQRKLERPLPATLEELVDLARSRRPDVRDPETGAPYEYEVLARTRFRLCATFRLERDEDADPFWTHGPGRQCFEIDVLRP